MRETPENVARRPATPSPRRKCPAGRTDVPKRYERVCQGQDDRQSTSPYSMDEPSRRRPPLLAKIERQERDKDQRTADTHSEPPAPEPRRRRQRRKPRATAAESPSYYRDSDEDDNQIVDRYPHDYSPTCETVGMLDEPTTEGDDAPERHEHPDPLMLRLRQRRTRRNRQKRTQRMYDEQRMQQEFAQRHDALETEPVTLEPQWRHRQQLHELMLQGIPPNQATEYDLDYEMYAPPQSDGYTDDDEDSDLCPMYPNSGLKSEYVHNPMNVYGGTRPPCHPPGDTDTLPTSPKQGKHPKDKKKEAKKSPQRPPSPATARETVPRTLGTPEEVLIKSRPTHDGGPYLITPSTTNPTNKHPTDAKQDEKIAEEVPNIETTDPKTQKNIRRILHRNADLFAVSDLDLGLTNLVELTIDTGSSLPIRQRATTYANRRKKKIQEMMDKMLEAGIISPSASPWTSPVTLIGPPNGFDDPQGQWRLMVDYRKLNKVTKRWTLTLPDVDELIRNFSGTKVMSLLDLKCGYWQIPVAPADRQKTAMITQTAIYEFNRVPYGVANAPSIFCKLMQKVLRGLQPQCCFSHLDMVIVYSPTAKDHERHLQEVFDRIRNAGLKMKLAGCRFHCPSLELLGHRLTTEGIAISPLTTRAILHLSRPTNAKTMRAFITMCTFYRRHMPDFIKVTKPLTEICKKNAKFIWTEQCQESFDTLKETLATAPMLPYPSKDEGHTMVLHTDASLDAIGAILAQRDPEGNERVLQYFSEALPEDMKNYTVSEIECFAIVRAVLTFQHYLQQRPFTLYTDHAPLLNIQDTRMHNERIQRWAIILAAFEMDVQYKPGPLQKADFLSRIPASGNHAIARPEEEMEYRFLPEIRSLQSEPETPYDRRIRYLAEDVCDMCHEPIGEDLPDDDARRTAMLYCVTSPDYEPPPRICERCDNQMQATITTPEEEYIDMQLTPDSPDWDPTYDVEALRLGPMIGSIDRAAQRYLEETALYDDIDLIDDPHYTPTHTPTLPPPDVKGSCESYENESYENESYEEHTEPETSEHESWIPLIAAMEYANPTLRPNQRRNRVISTHAVLKRRRKNAKGLTKNIET